MLRTFVGLMGFALAEAGALQAAQQSAPASTPATQYRATLNRYCVTCHNERLKTAGLMLDKMDVENVPPGAEVWEKVIRKVETHSMPPAGLPRPDNTFYESFPTYLETAIDRAAFANLNPGRTAVHRLNRAEYTNVIRDLLGLEIDAETLLPLDETGSGFDNNANALSVSPLLLERYESAARKISRMAIGDPAIRPESHQFDVSMLLVQKERVSEDLPFRSRGGTAIRYNFPTDGEYMVSISLLKSESPLNLGAVIGLGEPHQLEVRVDRALVKRLTIGGESEKGTYYYQDAAGKPSAADAGLKFRFAAKAGTRLVGVDFINDILEDEADSEVILRPDATQANLLHRYQDGEPSVQSVTISGPFNSKGTGDTASRRQIFVCRPTSSQDEEPCAKKILSTLARRAYRRPLTDSDLRTLLGFYKTGRSGGGSFEAGIEMGLRRILFAPDYLFRAERDPAKIAAGASYRISDLELASRLSFFLWSSMPDEELLSLAEHGKLKDSAVLEQQVRRMLRDSRSKALTDNFFGQWLQLRNLGSTLPNMVMFLEFDENLRAGFETEANLFLESMLREDHSILNLLDANYTFVNDRLARHYGIPNIYGSQFRRVTLSDENRWGLLGKGGILTLTSHPNRTSPVTRGKYVLENFLGAPPPPPPPNVPALSEEASDGRKLTSRQAIEQHRANPVCSSCHARMDPIGFALENFNPIGGWRTTDANSPIDTSAALVDGTKFQGPVELRKVLLSRPEQFLTTVTENLLTYALGRGVEYYDEPVIRKIVRDSASSNYTWSSVILHIVNSPPFQMRKAAEPATRAGLR